MDIVAELKKLLGDDIVGDQTEVGLARHSADYGVRGSLPIAVVCPRTTEDVSAILRLCNERSQPVVPQGGMTGLAGGAIPRPGFLALSLERMRAIEEIDTVASTITVQAGALLQTLQEAAEAEGFLLPLDLGARGSCQAGGLASTNAGGNRVLRYGMARQLILGMEVVLADGEVVTTLNKMLKNNAGYDVKQMFIGSEGTLGVITRLVFRLVPQSNSTCTAICATSDYGRALELLARAQVGLSGDLSAFEVMWPDFYAFGTGLYPTQPPIGEGHRIYILLDALGADPEVDQARFEGLIERAIMDGLLDDAVVARSTRDAAAFWAIRDAPSSLQSYSPYNNYDVSIPVGQIGGFVEACKAKIQNAWPESKSLFFGHVADSNLHIVVHKTPLEPEKIDAVVYGVVREWKGSISAEHGIGTLKVPYLGYSRSPAEIDLMRRIKKSLDPNGILNPGKVFDLLPT